MLCDGGLDSQNETVPVPSSVITNARDEVDIQILQFSRSRAELRPRAPQAREIFRKDRIVLASTRRSKECLIPSPISSAPGYLSVKESGNDFSANAVAQAFTRAILVID
jgi:hypothetical protein